MVKYRIILDLSGNKIICRAFQKTENPYKEFRQYFNNNYYWTFVESDNEIEAIKIANIMLKKQLRN